MLFLYEMKQAVDVCVLSFFSSLITKVNNFLLSYVSPQPPISRPQIPRPRACVLKTKIQWTGKWTTGESLKGFQRRHWRRRS